MDLDLTSFNSTLNRYMAVTTKDLAEVLNTKLLFIARSALRLTPRANRAEIERALGVTGYHVSRSKKTGEFKRRAAIISGPRAAHIVNARRREAGEPGLQGPEMERAVKKLIASRVRAIGSLAAGWVRAIRTLAAKLNLPAPSDQLPRVKVASRARAAEPGWNPVAEMEYGITVQRENQPQIDPRVERALAEAFSAEQASMEDYITRKLQERADKMLHAP